MTVWATQDVASIKTRPLWPVYPVTAPNGPCLPEFFFARAGGEEFNKNLSMQTPARARRQKVCPAQRGGGANPASDIFSKKKRTGKKLHQENFPKQCREKKPVNSPQTWRPEQNSHYFFSRQNVFLQNSR
jgi:hypothetical protein